MRILQERWEVGPSRGISGWPITWSGKWSMDVCLVESLDLE